MIFFLRTRDCRLCLVGEVETLVSVRAWLAGPNFMIPPCGRYKNFSCEAMAEGDDRLVLELCEQFRPPVRWVWDGSLPFVAWGPEVRDWIATRGLPWDGREAERLGVRGLGVGRHASEPAATLSSLGDRVRRVTGR